MTPETPNIQEATANVSFDMLTAIKQLANEGLRDINWASYASGEGFIRDRTNVVLYKLQARLESLQQMANNVKTK